MNTATTPLTRRHFLTRGTHALAATAFVSAATHAHAQGSGRIKMALVGCGGRGTGAASQALNAGSEIELVAIADLWEDKAKTARKLLSDRHAGQVKIDDDHIFSGFEG